MTSALGERLVLSFLDVTERHEVERLKKEFAAMARHDLRAPLTSVMGSLALLSTSELSDANKKVIANSEFELARLNLLDIAKMEAGKLSLDLDVVDVASMIATSRLALPAKKGLPLKLQIRKLK